MMLGSSCSPCCAAECTPQRLRSLYDSIRSKTVSLVVSGSFVKTDSAAFQTALQAQNNLPAGLSVASWDSRFNSRAAVLAQRTSISGYLEPADTPDGTHDLALSSSIFRSAQNTFSIGFSKDFYQNGIRVGFAQVSVLGSIPQSGACLLQLGANCTIYTLRQAISPFPLASLALTSVPQLSDTVISAPFKGFVGGVPEYYCGLCHQGPNPPNPCPSVTYNYSGTQIAADFYSAAPAYNSLFPYTQTPCSAIEDFNRMSRVAVGAAMWQSPPEALGQLTGQGTNEADGANRVYSQAGTSLSPFVATGDGWWNTGGQVVDTTPVVAGRQFKWLDNNASPFIKNAAYQSSPGTYEDLYDELLLVDPSVSPMVTQSGSVARYEISYEMANKSYSEVSPGSASSVAVVFS